MLYIIEMMASDSFDNPTVFKNIIKIGYTRNFDKRIKGYYKHNPFFRIIKLFEGDEFDGTKRTTGFKLLEKLDKSSVTT